MPSKVRGVGQNVPKGLASSHSASVVTIAVTTLMA